MPSASTTALEISRVNQAYVDGGFKILCRVLDRLEWNEKVFMENLEGNDKYLLLFQSKSMLFLKIL